MVYLLYGWFMLDLGATAGVVLRGQARLCAQGMFSDREGPDLSHSLDPLSRWNSARVRDEQNLNSIYSHLRMMLTVL